MLNRILVATDFSEQADAAVQQAAAIAEAAAAELILCHVAIEPPYPLPSKLETEELAKVANATQEQLDTLAQPLRARGLQVSTEIRTGFPDEGIVKAAADTSADLIVTGTHGRSGLARFFLGSVAEKVVRIAQTNVFVARGALSGERPFNKILVPTDFSPASKKALLLAMALATEGAQVVLFHAWHYPAGTHSTRLGLEHDPLSELKAEIIKEAETKGADWVKRYGRSGVQLEFKQIYGTPTAAVDDELQGSDYDLVAMGTHGYRGFRRFMLGSCAEVTVRHAPCSVLVAHAGSD